MCALLCAVSQGKNKYTIPNCRYLQNLNLYVKLSYQNCLTMLKILQCQMQLLT